MANKPSSLDEEFDSVLLEDRKDIGGRYEALALAYGDYSSRPNNRWLRSLPVVLAPAVESQWTFDSSSSDVFNDMDRDFLESIVSRSCLTLDQIEGKFELFDNCRTLLKASGSELGPCDIHRQECNYFLRIRILMRSEWNKPFEDTTVFA